MESVIERFLADESGDGNGEDFSSGGSDCCGDGGGNDAGLAHQRGNGTASGDGDDKGCGYGRGDGPGRGLDDDDGSDESYFDVDDYERGTPAGSGAGVGGGIKSINGMPVYSINYTLTIIESVHDDGDYYAKGYIVEDTGYLRPCYIAKSRGRFAHGHTLGEAQEELAAGYDEDDLAALWQEDKDEEWQWEGLEVSGTINGHEYVDLGLSVKWATMNVGASSREDYGDYYAWGELRTKESYTDANCETWNKKIKSIKGTYRDVAHVKWGGTWRMPTGGEILELVDKDNCTWTWTTQNGHKGYKVTSRKNGNSIFLPAAGWRYDTSHNSREEYGGYWGSASPYPPYAVSLIFISSYSDAYCCGRYSGFTVRPVTE